MLVQMTLNIIRQIDLHVREYVDGVFVKQI